MSRAPSAASLPSAAVIAGSPSSGHLRPDRAPTVIPVVPPFHSSRFRLLPWCVRGDRAPIAGAACRGRGAPPPPCRVIRELIDDEDPSPLLASLPLRGAHPRAGCCFLRSSSAHRSQCRLPLPAAGARRRSCGTLYTELVGGQGGAPRGRVRELIGSAGRRSHS
jgi:hypothetical protein